MVISGSGDVAQYIFSEPGATVICIWLKWLCYRWERWWLRSFGWRQEKRRARLTEYAAEKATATYHEGSVWTYAGNYDIALPCATQNEINGEAAKRLICSRKFISLYRKQRAAAWSALVRSQVYKTESHGPAKAANAGGGCIYPWNRQNSLAVSWTREEVDGRLKDIMTNIFNTAKTTAETWSWYWLPCRSKYQLPSKT